MSTDLTPTPDGSLEVREFPNLTALQERFAHEYSGNGGKAERAAIAAGYSKASARTTATDLLKHSGVCEAILLLTKRAQARHVPGALARIAALSQRAKSEYVQLEASKDVLSRAGVEAPKRVAVAGQFSVSFDLSERGEGGGG